jgi:hypothetical protein
VSLRAQRSNLELLKIEIASSTLGVLAMTEKGNDKMTDDFTQSEQQQVIERLLRESSGLNENAFVTSAGGKAIGFVAKVISKYNYNHYNVRAVEVGTAGTIPIVVGQEIRAVNVAESFYSQGNLAAGKYVIMFKIGDYYCFYAPVN